ncbi:MAG: ribosome assembly RNA-binding protein YhbY [Magnetococcales bacterium]|nr:ribosome assembly RNA-binding protein YhbY [Magnetococcales bacterium]
MTTTALTGKQKKHLRALAHPLKPVVLIGANGANENVIEAINDALDRHELIKIRFQEHKEERKQITPKIAESTGAVWVGMVGHVALLFRRHKNPEKRRVLLPGEKPPTPRTKKTGFDAKKCRTDNRRSGTGRSDRKGADCRVCRVPDRKGSKRTGGR